MINILNGLKDVFATRLKNLFLMNFILSWMFVNYKITLEFLFKDQTIEERINLIDITFSNPNYFKILILPLLLTALYIFCFSLAKLSIK